MKGVLLAVTVAGCCVVGPCNVLVLLVLLRVTLCVAVLCGRMCCVIARLCCGRCVLCCSALC